MKTLQKISAFALLLLLGVAAFELYQTGKPVERTATPAKAKSGSNAPPAAIFVDTAPLKTAQKLAFLADTEDEQSLAKQALHLGDYEVDLAYSAALHEAKEHPPALSADAKDAKERLDSAQKTLAADDAVIAQLNAVIAKTPAGDKKDKLEEQLDGMEADRNLAEDEADDAQEDFQQAGGDLEDRIQAAQKALKATQGSGTNLPANVAALSNEKGLIHRFEQWKTLHSKQLQLWQAKQNAEVAIPALELKHNTLETKLDAEKEKSPELAHHSRKKKDPDIAGKSNSSSQNAGSAEKPPAAPPNASVGGQTPGKQRNLDDVVAVADKTWKLAYDQQMLAMYDKRVDANKELAGVYANWIEEVEGRQRGVLHSAFVGVALILGIALVGLFFDSWMENLVGRLTMDRRQVETLRTVTRVSVQVLGLLFILLVIFGPPSQLGTFLGLAGAGLTVALKDFIVGFIGWFVLMGRNGVRLGDWVEINGVTGEVVELGMFHTVLLETGNWTDSGHPTGRRVTFTNSFAIEGHYFNFSTSGQWLWDELQIVLPAGKDPYPIVDAIQKKVLEATSDSSRQAEEEWKSAASSRNMNALSAAPAINVKPVIGGVEIAVRYITRANERYQLRAKLNQAAVDLLGPGSGVEVSAAPEAPAEAPKKS
jgi:small-conductance mechanosensitive channel